MKKRLEVMWEQARMAVRSNPVEVLLAILVCWLNCYRYEKGEVYAYDMLIHYFPVLFLFTYMLNSRFKEGKLRAIYYLSAVICLFFLGFTERWELSATYIVSLVVIQLVYLVSGWKRDNQTFMGEGLRYLRALLSSGLLAGIIWLLSLSIYFCITYIFEIWEKTGNNIFIYIPCLSFMGVMPLLFLMFNEKKDEVDFKENRLFDVLLNYVLSPALLIYAVILYLYFIKIAILWSLPKGAVAYIVVSFTSAVFLLKGCQVFLAHRYYDWFYNRASLVVIPTLVMYWIGSLYRIHEYGFTELRVYLVVVGMILTGVAFLFFSNRWGRYLFVALWAIGLLVVVTYIPGITAQDIERISQADRDNNRDKMEIIPVYLEISSNEPIPIEGYHSLEKITNYDGIDGIINLDFKGDTLSVLDKNGTLMYQQSTEDFLGGQMAKVGLTWRDTIPVSAYPEFLQLELDSGKVVLESIHMMRDTVYHVNSVYGDVYLKR